MDWGRKKPQNRHKKLDGPENLNYNRNRISNIRKREGTAVFAELSLKKDDLITVRWRDIK